MPAGGFVVYQNTLTQGLIFAECFTVPLIGWLFAAYLIYLKIFKPEEYKALIKKCKMYSLIFLVLIIALIGGVLLIDIN